jgi:DNA glycosylase AlkZ-like
MTNLKIAYQRLHNQLITRQKFENAGEVVKWLCAVQAQDFAAAKWALGLRMQNSTDEIIERAFTDGTILRTHLLRPTWHFVLPADIRWMLALTAPRVNTGNASWYRRLELDDALFMRSNSVLTKALQGGRQLTRAELVSVLQRAGIATDDLQRFTYIMMRAELDGIICSGGRRGKQFTYALLDERAPQARVLEREESLAELARRYFTSHGPATLQDFVWWSGLTVVDARVGLEMVASQLSHEVIGGQKFWFSSATSPVKDLPQTVYLLPNFDEYTVGYTDRSAIFDMSEAGKFGTPGNVLNPTIVLDGLVVGTWKRTITKQTVTLTPSLFTTLNKAEASALFESASRYSVFLDMPVNVDLNLS